MHTFSSCILCLFLAFTFNILNVNGNAPQLKTYREIKVIDLVVPLKSGFHVILTREFAENYLQRPDSYLAIFLSASEISVTNKTASTNIHRGVKLAREQSLKLEHLFPNTWYYVCAEYESVDHQDNTGTTSTDCQLARTLDEHGGKVDSPITKISPIEIGKDYVEFSIKVDVGGLGRLTAFLEKGSRPSQEFIMDQTAEVEVYFAGLGPGLDYGRLCVLYEPLTKAYSMLGRSIRKHVVQCHPRPVHTKKN